MNKEIFVLIVLSSFGVVSTAWANKACFEVQGMTCATCPLTVKAAVKKLSGVNKVTTSLEEKNSVVDFDSKKINASEIQKAIDAVGYKAILQECKNNKG